MNTHLSLRKKTWRTGRLFALGAFAVAGMVACGGGNEVDKPASFDLLPDDLVGAPCSRCRSGYLVGVAADGAPLADAEVLVVDARGNTARTRTSADGRYEVPAGALTGTLLVQVAGSSSGEPVMLHSLAVAVDVGNRAVNVTPLTELMAAYVLGGTPHELLQSDRVDFMRITATTLRSNLDRVRNLVRPVLELAGATTLDPRTGDVESRFSGLDGVHRLLDLQRLPTGYALRATASSQAPIVVDPVASSSDAVLDALSTAEQASSRAALAELPDIERQLEQLTARFASELPAAEALAPLFTADFQHTGLAAAAYLSGVLLRHEPEALGGASLQGARFDAPRVLQVASPDRLLVRFKVTPKAPAPSYSETLWMQKVGGTWLWQGDGQVGRVRVRNVAVLGPRPQPEADLKSQPGMQCAALDAAGDVQCRIEGGQAGVPAGGLMEFGVPGSDQFGLFASYRSDAPTWQERLSAARLNSRALGTPSARVSRHLSFEVDGRRIDARVQRVRVSGPGLPAEGLELMAASGDAPAGFEFLPLAQRPDQDAHQVALGHCPDAAGTGLEACLQGWEQLRAGTAYSFAFMDKDGGTLQTLTARLPSRPLAEEQLTVRRSELFARFDLAAAPDQQPLYARVVAPELEGRKLNMAWSWRNGAAAQVKLIEGTVELHMASPLSDDVQVLRTRQSPARLLRSDGSAVWDLGLDIPQGWLPVWLVASLHSQDALGNRFTHYVAPNNPN